MPAERWRTLVALAVLAFVVALFSVVRPAELGPWISAVVVGGALVVLAVTLARWTRTARVAIAAASGLAGAVGGFVLGLGLDIGPTSHQLSRAVSAIGVPAGFERSGDYSCDLGPFCPETVYTRDYVGSGSVAAVADTMLARMRKACFTDSVIGPGGSFSTTSAFVVSGTCSKRDAAVRIGIGEEQTSAGRVEVRIAFSASGL